MENSDLLWAQLGAKRDPNISFPWWSEKLGIQRGFLLSVQPLGQCLHPFSHSCSSVKKVPRPESLHLYSVP